MARGSLMLIVAVIACGCGLAEEEEHQESVEQYGMNGQCPIWACGSNSPEIDNRGFHDLHERGLANSAGFRIAAFSRYGVPYGIDVRRGKLYGLTSSGQIALSGSNLKDAKMLIENGSVRYLVRINAVAPSTRFWAQLPGVAPWAQPKLESYVLEWVPTIDGVNPTLGMDWKNVCSQASPDRTNPEYLGMYGEFAVLFDGERIDAVAKTISTRLDDQWFNLGCAGHALAKLYLTGHTQAARSAGFDTSIEQRQTILKMFSADYCGNGMPFTVAGTPLSWKDDKGWMQHQPGIVGIEARWTPKGATCVTKPRIDENPSSLSVSVFPNGAVKAIEHYCGYVPDPCPGTPSDLDGTHVVTANL